eukprot:m.117430 g.117430  ORF g.117430 m.117430 type:complete len:115 (+) comp14250_c0_seq8:35-379(+)
MSSSVATYDDVVQAARRMRGRLHKTQVAESLALNNLCGARVLVKCEALQRTGTFKFRGALNRILRLSAAEREAGVVAFSSGNFGQGLAVRKFVLTFNFPMNSNRLQHKQSMCNV